MARRNYVAVIHQDKQEGPYGVSFPDFPGCVAVGDTVEEALNSAEDAVAFHVEDMIADKEPVPEPSGRATVELDGGMLALVPVLVPGKSINKTISIDENLCAEIVARGHKLSRFLADAARQKLAIERTV